MFRLPADFVPFQSQGAFRNYMRNLPHWRQPDVSYFLTFRLNDSLPAEVGAELRRENLLWQERLARLLAKHGDQLPQELEEQYDAFLRRRYRRVERILDEGCGSCLLRDPDLRRIVEDSLLHFHGERCNLQAFVIMPNHVHLAVRPLQDWQPEELLHSWKRFSARRINQMSSRTGQLWQEDSWSRIIRDAAHWETVMRYIVANPARAGLGPEESTTWVNPLLQDDSDAIREEGMDDPWQD